MWVFNFSCFKICNIGNFCYKCDGTQIERCWCAGAILDPFFNVPERVTPGSDENSASGYPTELPFFCNLLKS